MVNLIFKHKFIFSFFLILILFLIFNINNCFGATYDYNHNNLTNNDKEWIDNCMDLVFDYIENSNNNFPSYNNYYIFTDTWNSTFDGANLGHFIILYTNAGTWYNKGAGLGYRNNNNRSAEFQFSRGSNSVIQSNFSSFGYMTWNGDFYGNGNYMIFTNDNIAGLFSTREYVRPVEDSPFLLEYNEVTETYFIVSKWRDYIDDSINDDFWHFSIYRYSNFFDIDEYHSEFDYEIRDLLGWKNFISSDFNSGEEFNHKEDYTELPSDLAWRDFLEVTDFGEYYCCCYDHMLDTNVIMRFVFDEDSGQCYYETFDETTGLFKNQVQLDSSTIIDNIAEYSQFDYFKLYSELNECSASIFTNYFNNDNGYIYKVEYSTGNNSSWSSDTIFPDEIKTADGGSKTRYILDVYNDGEYSFRLSIYDSNSNFVKYKIEKITISGITANNVLGLVKDSNLYKSFQSSLGILWYPIDIVFDFMNRISNINNLSPVIHVPQLTEVFTNRVIINEFDFSLNSILSQDERIANAYNIYLVFADFIIYTWLFRFLYKTCKDFINVYGGIE